MDYIEKNALQIVLDFVEAWNKKDVDRIVAESARQLQEWLDKN